MKLTVLVDNTASIDYPSEWGLSILLEEKNQRFLLDTGVSDLFLQNAKQSNTDLKNLDAIILSHGHYDHTWGLKSLINYFDSEAIPLENRPVLICHSLALNPKIRNNGSSLGIDLSIEELQGKLRLNPTSTPVWLTEKLVYLGEIPRQYGFENQNPLGRTTTSGDVFEDDFLWDDTALAFKGENGLVIVTGCSHSGICNIVDYAQHVCNEKHVDTIVGGFHLLAETPPEQTDATLEFLKRTQLRQLYPCHCVNLGHKIALSCIAPVGEIRSGIALSFE